MAPSLSGDLPYLTEPLSAHGGSILIATDVYLHALMGEKVKQRVFGTPMSGRGHLRPLPLNRKSSESDRSRNPSKEYASAADAG